VEQRPGAGEEWLAIAKHDGAQVESILIDKTGLGQALRQDWSANINLASQLSLQPAYRLLEVIRDKRSVGANCLEERDATHFGWLRHATAKSRSSASQSRAATVDEARQAAHLLDEVAEDRRHRRPKLHVVAARR
jgi:hypothetical protein